MEDVWLRDHRRKLFGKWLIPGLTALEFGARDVWTLRALDARSKIVCAPRAEPTVFIQEQIRIYEAPAALPDACADLVICDCVLEYLPEPRTALIHLKRALRSNGVIVVHALDDPDFRGPRFDRAVDHYFSWNVQTMGNLLVDCGFDFLEGGVRKLPCEERVLQTSRRFGIPLAVLWARLFDSERRVSVSARLNSK